MSRSTGPIGERGPTGDKGAHGQTGDPGTKGLTGDEGQLGERGDTGGQGPIGERGPRGDRGDRGDPGIQGERGVSGVPVEEPSVKQKLKAVASRPSLVIIGVMSTVMAIVLILFYAQLDGAINNINKERQERADQACLGAETLHQTEIKDLRRTYAIMENPPPVLETLLKNPLLLEQTKEEIKAALNDEDEFGVFVAPYCDEKGFGRPEPDPKVPKQPQVVKDLLGSINGE
jgi:hypothetical protein